MRFPPGSVTQPIEEVLPFGITTYDNSLSEFDGKPSDFKSVPQKLEQFPASRCTRVKSSRCNPREYSWRKNKSNPTVAMISEFLMFRERGGLFEQTRAMLVPYLISCGLCPIDRSDANRKDTVKVYRTRVRSLSPLPPRRGDHLVPSSATAALGTTWCLQSTSSSGPHRSVPDSTSSTTINDPQPRHFPGNDLTT